MSGWALVYDRFDPAQESLREALCTLGNGNDWEFLSFYASISRFTSNRARMTVVRPRRPHG